MSDYIQQIDLSLGLDKKLNRGFKQIKNFVWDGQKLRKRKGRVLLRDFSTQIRGVFGNKYGDGWRRIVVSNGVMYVIRDVKAGTTTASLSGLSSTAEWDFTNFLGSVYATNRVNGLYRVTSTAISPVDTDPPFAYIQAYKDFVLGSGADNNASLFWSSLGTGDIWPLANFNKLGPDSEPHMGITTFKDWAIVFKQDSIWSVLYSPSASTSNPFIFRQESAVGTIAPRSIVSDGNAVYFMGDEHPMVWAGGDPQILMRVEGIDELPRKDRENCVATIYKNRYIVFFIGTEAYLFDKFTKNTRTWSVPQVTAAFTEYNYNGYMITGDTDGKLFWHDKGDNDNGSTITCTLELPTIDYMSKAKDGQGIAPQNMIIECPRNGNVNLTTNTRRDNRYNSNNEAINLTPDTITKTFNNGTFNNTFIFNSDESEYIFDHTFDRDFSRGRTVDIKVTENTLSTFYIKDMKLVSRQGANRSH